MKIISRFLWADVIIYLFVYAFFFVTEEVAPNWNLLFALIPTIVPLVFSFRIKRFDEKNIPLILEYKKIDAVVEIINPINTVISSLEEFIIKLRSADGDEIKSLISDAKKAIDSYSNKSDYQPVVELIRLVSQERKHFEQDLYNSLSNNVSSNVSKLSEKIYALKYIIQARLPIEHFLNIFKEISNKTFAPPNEDIPIESLLSLYCEVLRLALSEATYADKHKQQLVDDYVLIFAHFNDKFTPINPPQKIIDVMCLEYAGLRPLIRGFLPAKDYVYEDSLRGINDFERRFMPRENERDYNIDEWIEEIKGQSE